MRVKILIPVQKDSLSVFNSIFDTICAILEEEKIKYDKVYISFLKGREKKCQGGVVLESKELISYIKNEEAENIFFTIDDYNLLRAIYGVNFNNKVIIWVHYFIGHRFIFRRYNEIDSTFSLSTWNKIVNRLAGFIPIDFLPIMFRKYIEPLKKNFILSQSVWTDLLLERIYSIRTMGLLPIPIFSELWQYSHGAKKEGIIVFLGNYSETDLNSLHVTLKLTKEYLNTSKIDYFGNEKTGSLFSKEFGIPLNYLGKLSQEELKENYQNHILTICPIYNGNFEMVPVESILCGTPTITYIQPFMEVAGSSAMIANILNHVEIKIKIDKWIGLDTYLIEKERKKILERMDSNKVGKSLIEYIMESINMTDIELFRKEFNE